VSMTGNIDRIEVITSVQRRRRWSTIVQETYAPGMSVSLVARRRGIAPNQLFWWRQLCAEGALLAVGVGEEVGAGLRIPRFAESRARAATAARQEDIGKRDPARGAGFGAAKKTAVALALVGSGRHAVKRVAEALGVARSNLAVQAAAAAPRRRRGRRPHPETELLTEIKKSSQVSRPTATGGSTP
jgi:transposase-like protein